MKIALIGYGKMGKEIEKVASVADTKLSALSTSTTRMISNPKRSNRQMWPLNSLIPW